MDKRLAKILDASDIIAGYIIKGLLEVGEMTLDMCMEVLTTPKVGRGRWRSVYMGFYRLEKKGYVEKKVKAGKLVYRLTEPTRQELLALQKLKLKIANQRSKWDGKWRLVPFDVPEVKKKHREALRRKLKQLGFERYQQSIWLTPYPLNEDFYEVVEEVGLANCVEIIETNFMPRQSIWLKKFKLGVK